MTDIIKNPFTAGNWVRGENFFGRQQLLEEILQGSRHYLWVAGTRRFGKTSLLKQLEWLTTQGTYSAKYIPVFWDMQGSRDADGLKETLLLSIELASKRFEAIGLDLDELETKNVLGILRALRRHADQASLNLMLLCDEVEELINVEKNNPEILPRLRSFFQSGHNVFTVLTATRRLSVLESNSPTTTSPFLYGFVPPIYLSPLEEDSARRLITQWDFDQGQIQEIIDKTSNHPYLIQLICSRLIESDELKEVAEELSHDSIISNFFSVDFQALREDERAILLHLLQKESLALEELLARIDTTRDKLIPQLYDLVRMGIIKRIDKSYQIANYFFRKWLDSEREQLYTESDVMQVAAVEAKAPTARSNTVANPLRVGQTLAGHEILEEIGSGGMGVIFKARDIRLNRIVAMKILTPKLMHDPGFKERFLLEAQAASKLNHPNITTIYQVGEENGVLFISMEYVEGQTLGGWANEADRSLPDKLRVCIEAGRGLQAAHERGITHRDIKPDNIMVSAEGQVKVMDFGIAKHQGSVGDGLTSTGITLGTTAYMSPEQACGSPVDHQSDIFSFGVVLYELFTGKLPFLGSYDLAILYDIMNEEPEPLRQSNPDLPEDLEIIVLKAMEKTKEKRYQTIEDVLAKLQALSQRAFPT